LLRVKIQAELVGVRPEADGIDLVLALVGDPGVDHVGGEDIAFEEEVAIAFEGGKRFVKSCRGRIVVTGP